MTSSRRNDSSKTGAASRSRSKGAAARLLATAPVKSKAVAASALKRRAELDTRIAKTATRKAGRGAEKRAGKTIQPIWLLQDAKARFSELVRRVKSEGPQQVSVHGNVEVVVISADDYRRLKGEKTGAALIAALQASPHRDVDIAPNRAPMPVRSVEL